MGLFSAFKSLFNNNNNSSKNTSREVITNEINPILTKKTEIGLTPGEIILLDWCNGAPEDKLFPQYFKYNYNINARKSVQILLNQEFLEYGSSSDQLASLKVKELKNILSDNNIVPKGRKKDLINQIVEADIKVNNLPKAYSLTFKGRETVRDYEHIILAHKDRYFDVSSAISYRRKLPYPYGYGDLKWSYLGDQAMLHTKEQNFGLLRNDYLAQADHLDTESKYHNALSHYIVVVLLDASGIGNSYGYYNSPYYTFVDVIPGIFESIGKVIVKGSLTKEGYNDAFSRALRFFTPVKSLSFLSDKDIIFLKEEIYNLDYEAIEKYLKKYEGVTFKEWIKQ